ncbi:SIR2-like domain protein [Eubacterium nodatum ATCC 33099]|nr:SIR2-like domain protein [Eubacterium nodatum ATCC 33099]
MASKEEFIREYTTAITQGYAALFSGAGLSRAMGFVSWKELVKPLAEDIELNVDKEHDLIAVAQYYKNEKGGNAGINRQILNSFNKDVELNENIKILTKLPIQTYWTTNYDHLLEEALKFNNRKADVKITKESLANNIYDRDAIVYKMHGDCSMPENAVLTKDDYDLYSESHPLFRAALRGDLVSKTFLFVGFSFEDPNLDYILSQIKVLLGENRRDHYCFFEKSIKITGETERDYENRRVRQKLKINDLKRYGIQAVLLDSYDEITEILKEVEKAHLLKNIFISGSLSDRLDKINDSWNRERIASFANNLSKRLVKEDYRIISGFGNTIGSLIINGALEEIFKSKYKHVDEHLYLRPFPQVELETDSKEEIWQKYREDMIGESGIAIFIFGNKCENEDVKIADGMIKEFYIACEQNKLIIPVGSTGGAARVIYDTVKNNMGEYSYLNEYIDALGTETEPDKLVELICKIIKAQQKIRR